MQKYKQGNEKVFRFLIGQVATVTEQKANIELVDKTLKMLLKKWMFIVEVLEVFNNVEWGALVK